MALTILEEFLLLAIQDQSGAFWPVPRDVLDHATAIAVLMDLMRLKRIDCDTQQVFIVDAEPTGDDILDPVLHALALDPVRSTRALLDEVRFLSGEGDMLRENAVARLRARGVMSTEEHKIFVLFSTQSHPAMGGSGLQQVKSRVVATVLSDDIPDPHDSALVALAAACDLFRHWLGTRELERAASRIHQVARMDVLGCALVDAVNKDEVLVAVESDLL